MKPLIIITDPAPMGDDAVAIAMLAGPGQVDIRLIIATSGNVWGEEAVRNARSLLHQLRRDDIRICIGTSSSAFQERYRELSEGTAGRFASLYIGAFSRKLPGKDICDSCHLFELIAAADRPDLMIIGPSSPLASVLRLHPELKSYVGHIYLMGGAIACGGNASPTAEFNFWFDPEAAEMLLASSLPITLLPLDAVRHLHYSPEFAANIDPRHPVARYVRSSAENVASPPICDEVMAAVTVDQGLVSNRRLLKLSVETKPGPRYGTVNVLGDAADRRPVEVVEKLSEAAFWQFAGRALSMQN